MVAQLSRAALAVTVAPMRHRHLRAVLDIENRCYPAPWSPSLFTHELSASGRRYLVALGAPPPLWWRGRPVLGYGGLLMQAEDAHITTIAVEPREHRRKVASHLLLALLREARGIGADAATLEVRTGNVGAQRLYASFGFRPVGVRPRYYSETQEDGLIMWHHDLQSEETDRLLAFQESRLSEPGGASGEDDLPVPWVQGRHGLRGGGG